MKHLKSLFYFLFFITRALNAQEIPFTFIGDQLGLPANECYNVMQDSKGYIWISTEAGLCRYNGSFCRIFDKTNGLPENSCYTVQEDKDGKIWITTSANRILTFSNDSLEEAPFSKSYAAKLANTMERAYILSIVNDSIFINSNSRTYSAGKDSKIVSVVFPEDNGAYNFIKTDHQLVLIRNYDNRKKTDDLALIGTVEIIITGKTGKKIIQSHYIGDIYSWQVLTAINNNGESFIGNHKTVTKLNPDNSYSFYQVPFPIISMYCDKDNGLWVGTVKGGVFHFPDTKAMERTENSLSGFSVSGTCVDNENGVWCSTLEKGVFYSRNKNIISYARVKGMDKPADLLKFEHGRLFTSAVNNELTEIKGDSILFYPLSHAVNYPIADILFFENSWRICGKNFVLRTDTNFQQLNYSHVPNTNFYIGATMLTPVGGRLLGIHTSWVFEIIKDQLIALQTPLPSTGKCVYYKGNNILLYGCTQALYKLDVTTNTSEITPGIIGVVKIIKTSSGEIWIITKENGIYKYTDENVENISKELSLPTERLFDITEDRFGTIWVATNIGLLKIIQKDGKYSTLLYTTSNGLLSDKISNIAADNNYLYVSGIEGLYKFPLELDLLNFSIPQIHLRALSVNGVTYSSSLPLELDHNNNSIKAEVDALTFKELNTPSLFYQLKGLKNSNDRNGTLKGNTISLDNLPPDNYELTIFAVNNNEIKSKNPVVIHFEIKKPFWQTTWFIAISSILFCITLFIVVTSVVSRIRRKEEEKTSINKRLAEFQLTALQAQMNPHFIFNAINSIQGYILKKNEQLAYDYLAKFSKLIRLVLNNSQEKSIPLKQELDMLLVYIELEQLRFDNSFEFILTIDEEVNQYETFIPTMLIQPYVENAIWHGLMNLEKGIKGVLQIDIRLIGNMLKITVEDNGIGRENAKVYAKKQHSHNSIGMKLTEQRINMINAMQGEEHSSAIISDVLNEEHKVIGTRVEIFISSRYE
ncbi:MAG: histidine kinase [Bacteroidia bacterium]